MKPLLLLSLLAAGCSKAHALPGAWFAVTSPRQLSGCVDWHRSDLGITITGSGVSTWANQGSAGSSGDATQSTDGNRPTYAASGGINGNAKLTFSSKALEWGLDLQGAKTIVYVVKLASEPHDGYSLLSLKGSTGPVFTEVLLDLSGYKYTTFREDFSGAGSGSGYDGSYGTSAAHAALITFDGASTYTSTLDGVSQSVVSSGTLGRVTTDLGSIGARVSSAHALAFGLAGDLYELIVYNRVLTSAEQDVLWRGYLKPRYGL